MKAFNLPSIELLNYEADDLIGSIEKKLLMLKSNNNFIGIKIYAIKYQIKFRLFDPMKSKLMVKKVFEKFGVNSIKDVQSLLECSIYLQEFLVLELKSCKLINKYKTLDNLLKMHPKFLKIKDEKHYCLTKTKP